MKRLWAWLIDRIGGFGIFATCLIGIPMVFTLITAAHWPLHQRILGSLLMLFVLISMARMTREEDRKKLHHIEAWQRAFELIEHLEQRGRITAEEADIIMRGLER